jgi:polyhydroxyalkanoate depolymerase
LGGDIAVFYLAYQWQTDVLLPFRCAAERARALLVPLAHLPGWRGMAHLAAGLELFARYGLTHERPDFGIDTVTVDGEQVAVVEEAVDSTPFATLLRFRKMCNLHHPKVLVVAPLSGHFATLLRGTVRTLLPDHDIYITDWHNARDVPVEAGPFGFEDHISHLIRFLQKMGPGSHIVAVCQPCVQALAAAAVMGASRDTATPRSMTLMAGPVDVRISPTRVNEFASGKPVEWFERHLISPVPWRLKGAGRRVYPGALQIAAFMAMNMQRHRKAHLDLYHHLIDGDAEKAAAIKSFYDEYFAVLDLPAEFYIETVDVVFQRALLAKGELTYRGETVDLRAIRRTALLTVEGELDDICALGQTMVAHDLCSGLAPFRKQHHMQPGVGHYGVFSGRRWENQVAPILRNMILANA